MKSIIAMAVLSFGLFACGEELGSSTKEPIVSTTSSERELSVQDLNGYVFSLETSPGLVEWFLATETPTGDLIESSSLSTRRTWTSKHLDAHAVDWTNATDTALAAYVKEKFPAETIYLLKFDVSDPSLVTRSITGSYRLKSGARGRLRLRPLAEAQSSSSARSSLAPESIF